MKNKPSWIFLILTGLFIFVSTYGFIHHIRCICFPYPLEYREGVVAYWINCLIDGKKLYPEIGQNPPYLHNPYTPLYYIITALAHKIFPETHTFFAGRLISFICLLIICFFIFKIVRLRASTTAGLISAGFFFCSPILMSYGSLGIVDLLALCCGIAGLYTATGKTKTGFLFSGIFCALAFLTKPVFILPGICVILALMISKEKRKNYFFIGLAVPAVFSFSILFFEYGKNIFTHLLALNLLPLSILHFFNVFSMVGIRHCLLFGLLAAFIGLMKDKKDSLYWYCILSPLTILFLSKTGSEANYFIEIIALSSIATGILLEKTEISAKKIFLLGCISQMFLFLPFKPASVFTKTYGQEIPAAIGSEPSEALKEAGNIITGELLSCTDPVLSEDIGWLVISDKEVLIEPYQFSQLAKCGRWDDSYVVGMINEKQFNMILISAESFEKDSEKFTESMLESIRKNYSIRRVVGNIYLLEPVLWNFHNGTIN